MNRTPQPHLEAPTALRDLSPHLSANVEWWFSQGFFDLPGKGRFSYMLTLGRRHSGPTPEVDIATNGWELILVVEDPETGARNVASWASATKVRDGQRESITQLLDGGISRELAQAFAAEVAGPKPLPPTRLVPQNLRAAAQGLDLEWEDFRISQAPDGAIQVAFSIPDDVRKARLVLAPVAPWIFESDVSPDDRPDAVMQYAACPRLELTGTLDGQPITGQGWFDHQWGTDGWFVPDKKRGYFFGWEWLAVNLDNGDDLLLWHGRDILRDETRLAQVFLFRAGQPNLTSKALKCKALSHWQSPDTFATYPVAWHFSDAEFDLDLTFTPARPDCEVPVYGPNGAVWEGRGAIRGTIGGHAVAGEGHLELMGYGFPVDFGAWQKRWGARIDAEIAAFLPRPDDLDAEWMTQNLGAPRYRHDPKMAAEMIAAPAWELFSRGGKHWRSVFGVLLLRALGQKVEPFEALVTVIPELLHAGSLMIDDIEDNSALRRGAPAIHKIFGQATTINAGNALYFLPLLLIGRHELLDSAQREEIYRVAIDLFAKAHLGQAQDLFSQTWAGAGDVAKHPEKYAIDALQTYTFKTAAPVRSLAQIACIVARADAPTTKAAMQYAETAGIAYQIIDDANNFADSPDWGKELGEDIREGRLTYVVLRALSALEGAARDRLWQIALAGTKGEVTPTLQHEACVLIGQSGAPTDARTEARGMVETAWQDLCKHVQPSPARTLLRLLVTRMFEESSAN